MTTNILLPELAATWLPRILTQIDRDPTSSTFGCCDRNWWHYKIRDFPSIILQQAGYTAYLASECLPWAHEKTGLQQLAAGSCLFWNKQVATQNSFDEYYPWEQGYPPLAFSTLAVMKMAHAGAVEPANIQAGAHLAAKLLTRRFEAQAANQQVAGMAAVLWLAKVFPGLIESTMSGYLVERTLALQTEEGWFWEYDGPDLGYLSVTIDCLWDAFDATGDERFVSAARKALQYTEAMTAVHGTNIGMHNARNTDYIVPYGIARLMDDSRPETRTAARRLVNRLYPRSAPGRHFMNATDDRYLCHYIGASVFRSLPYLEVEAVEPPQAEPRHSKVRHFELSGHALYPHALISLHKGGIFSVRASTGEIASDFGWAIDVNHRRYVTHWWSTGWKSERLENGWRISGDLVECREMISSPLKHVLLRVASRLLGSSLIRHLKGRLIFRKHASPYGFERRIYLLDRRVMVEDTLTGLTEEIVPVPAPRASRRHVASADSYHPEDFNPVPKPWHRTREIQRDGSRWHATTTYTTTPDTASEA
ncbi:MAG: hypothetical protein H7A43_06080 [Verrucomicrobia bacterium]|nr:hypothetical protein [Verrucomicrobiota bacterium]